MHSKTVKLEHSWTVQKFKIDSKEDYTGTINWVSIIGLWLCTSPPFEGGKTTLMEKKIVF